jgi:hypothetical protein
LYAILIAATVAEEEVVGTSLSIPESLFLPVVVGLVAMGGFWSASPAMERVKWEWHKEKKMWNSKKLKSRNDLDWMHSAILSFVWVVGDSVMIHFLRKRCLSVLTTHAIRTWDRGAKKFGSLKDFEVRGIHKKEPWAQRIRFISPIGMVICLKQKIKVETSPNRVIRGSIRSAPAFSG